jgi:hypothetical protein
MCFARSATTVGVQCSRTSPGSIFSSAEVGLSLLRPAPRLAGSEGARSTLWARSSAPGSSARRLPRVRQNAVLARVCLAPGCLGRRRRLPAWRTAAARSGLGCSVRLSALSGWSVLPGWSALSNCRLCWAAGSVRLSGMVVAISGVVWLSSDSAVRHFCRFRRYFCRFLWSARSTRISRGSAKSRCRIATSFVVGSVGFCRVGRSSGFPLGNILQPTSKTPKTRKRIIQGTT